PSLHRRRSQADDDVGLQYFNLGFQPWLARGNYQRVQFFVDAALSARLPFEMFYRIRHIDLFAIDACGLKRFVENFSGWADEWMTLDFFLISRLFSDQHQPGLGSAVAINRLRSRLPGITR